MLRPVGMRVRMLVAVIVVLAASATAAYGHVTKYAWTKGKAQVMLPDSATIALPPEVAGPLEAEINALLAQFNLLELQAQDRNDWLATGTYANYKKRLSEARDRLQKGLSIDSASCKGLGKALTGKRYKHFTCDAMSYVLEVPAVELRGGEGGALPQVVEGPLRRLGPYAAAFTLHVTGAARCIPQRLS